MLYKSISLIIKMPKANTSFFYAMINLFLPSEIYNKFNGDKYRRLYYFLVMIVCSSLEFNNSGRPIE